MGPCTYPLTLMYYYLDPDAARMALAFIHGSRSSGTTTIYNSSLRHWLSFVPSISTLAADPFMERMPNPYDRLLLARFLHFLVHTQHLTFSSLKLAWCSVAAHFDNSLRDSSCLRSPMIQRAYRGALTKRVNPTQHRPPRLPIGLETLHEVRPLPGALDISDPSIMPELASRVAAHYGSRLGEYTFNPANNDGHTLLARSVHFVINHQRIPSYSLSRSSAPVAACSHVELRWHTTKTNPKTGDIRRTSPAQVALLEDLFAWSLMSNCTDTDPFFAIRVGPNLDILSRGTYSTYLMDFGARHSLDLTAVSSHCHRHGGASQRIAFGSTRASLNQALGWSNRGNTADHYSTHIPTLDPSGLISLEDLRHYQHQTPTPTPSIMTPAVPTPSFAWGEGVLVSLHLYVPPPVFPLPSLTASGVRVPLGSYDPKGIFILPKGRLVRGEIVKHPASPIVVLLILFYLSSSFPLLSIYCYTWGVPGGDLFALPSRPLLLRENLLDTYFYTLPLLPLSICSR